MAAHSPPPAPEWLTGIWRRKSIVYSDGTEDRSTCVLWGQTRSRYVDLRIPADRPPARGRRSFDDFSEGELLLLAEQMGFAGHVVLKGDVCTWIRYIDFQPNTGRPDSGRLELNGDALHERGEASSVLGRDYHEIFHREHKAERCCALQSFAPTQGGVNEEGTARAVLILIDNHFLFAQARSEELPQGQSLRELVLAAGKDRSLIHRLSRLRNLGRKNRGKRSVAGHLFDYSLPRAATAAAALFCCAERGNRQSCFVLRFFPATLENHRVVDTHRRSRNSIQPVSQSDRALVRRQRRSEASRRLLSILPKTRSPERTSTSRPPWR